MIDANDVKWLQVEATTKCNAWCPGCGRNQGGFELADGLVIEDLDIDRYREILNQFPNLKTVVFCGTYGDAIATANIIELTELTKQHTEKIIIRTNGSLRTTKWWGEYANLLKDHDHEVWFCLDGLADTHSIYRQATDFDTIIKNAQAFIEAGGSAHWDMLVYKHNQYQVDECEQLARDMGFQWFRAKVSKRGFTDRLEAPIGWLNPRVQSTKVKCHALNEQSAYIDAQGNLSPCCWLGARQKNFVTDFDIVQNSWTSIQPNIVCLDTCGSKDTGTSFSNQWQKEVKFNV